MRIVNYHCLIHDYAGKGCNFAQKKRRASSVGERPYNHRSIDLSLVHFM